MCVGVESMVGWIFVRGSFKFNFVNILNLSQYMNMNSFTAFSFKIGQLLLMIEDYSPNRKPKFNDVNRKEHQNYD